MSKIADIAQAVTDELNAGSFSQEFTAQRTCVPIFELKDMASLHVTVVPKGRELETAARTIHRAVRPTRTAGRTAAA